MHGPLQPRGVLYFIMSLTPYSSSETHKKHKTVSCLSKHFIDTVFEYQREFIQTKHREKMDRLRTIGENAPKENDALKHEKVVLNERIESLQKELEDSKTSLKSDKDKIADLRDLTSGIVNGFVHQKPLSKEFLLRCKQRICELGL